MWKSAGNVCCHWLLQRKKKKKQLRMSCASEETHCAPSAAPEATGGVSSDNECSTHRLGQSEFLASCYRQVPGGRAPPCFPLCAVHAKTKLQALSPPHHLSTQKACRLPNFISLGTCTNPSLWPAGPVTMNHEPTGHQVFWHLQALTHFIHLNSFHSF